MEIIILDPLLGPKFLQFNNDLMEPLTNEAPCFNSWEIPMLVKLFKAVLSELRDGSAVVRFLRTSLCPHRSKKWSKIVLRYYAKMLTRGSRPIQEFPFMQSMFWQFMLRELFTEKQWPKAAATSLVWDFADVPLNSGQDKDVGSVWEMGKFTGAT